ncbi:MAG: PEP-CTERM sorting domain-containing protein [bacterium]|nr:PEP-CTERM sorting domain-containing protein [bacterium]
MSHRHFGVGLLLAVAMSASAMAQGVITDGNARYEFNNSSVPGSADFQPDGTSDYLFQNWWWYRVEEAPAESNFLWFPTDQSYVGNVATLGASEPSFDWDLTVTLTDFAAPVTAKIIEDMTLVNTSGTAISVALFKYADVDASGDAGNDFANLVNPNFIQITENADFVDFVGEGADAWEVQDWPNLVNPLNDASITNLGNTGLPFGPADFTGAFQWNLSIPAGGQVTVRDKLRINIPEPATLSLLAFGALAVIRRRQPLA